MKLLKSPKEIAGVGCSNISPEKQNFVGVASGVAFSGIMGGKNFFDQNISPNKISIVLVFGDIF